MISIDQVLLLEEKVESAVAKIAQLNAENAALRSKCAELTNALSAKTEQFSSFQSDQGRIEEGILKALERLNAVENAVHAGGQVSPAPAVQPVKQAASVEVAAPAVPAQNTTTIQEPEQAIPEPTVSFDSLSTNSFDTAEPVKSDFSNTAPEAPQQLNQQPQNRPLFDIF